MGRPRGRARCRRGGLRLRAGAIRRRGRGRSENCPRSVSRGFAVTTRCSGCPRRQRRRSRPRGEVGSLEVVDALDQLWDEEVEVRVALPVSVRPEVDRHAVQRGEEVGTVIEVEPAQEVLVGLPGSAVLGDDEARHQFQYLAWSKDGSVLDQLAGDPAGARGVGSSDRVLVMAGDHDLFAVVRVRARALCTSESRNQKRGHERAAARSRAGPQDGFHEISPKSGTRPRWSICAGISAAGRRPLGAFGDQIAERGAKLSVEDGRSSVLLSRDGDVWKLWRSLQGDTQVCESTRAVRIRTGWAVGVAVLMAVPVSFPAWYLR